jgi:hypothetical protein
VDDPAIKKLLDQYGSLWRQLDPVVAEAYARIQRKVPERTKPDASKYRSLLLLKHRRESGTVHAIRPGALGRNYEQLGIRQSWDGEENSHFCCAVLG